MNNKKRIAVVFGGKSVEHDISIITAQFIMAALDETTKYEVCPLYISKNGKWITNKSLRKLEAFGEFNDSKFPDCRIVFDGTKNKMTILHDQALIKRKKIEIDIVFPAMHGTNGEDGSLQGLLEMAQVPYIGCDLNSSAISMNKVITKNIFTSNNIPTVKYFSFAKDDYLKNSNQLIGKIEKNIVYPIFIKPANLGSSIGISKAGNKKELENSIEIASYYDSLMVAERGIRNVTEINCAIIGNEEPIASLLEQPVSKQAFLDFDEKYLNEGGTMKGAKSKVKIPAPLSEEKTAEIQSLAIKVFKALGCTGISRIDFLVDKNNNDKVYVNEINPLPGSLQQHLWQTSGISPSQLVDRLINLAIKKHDEKSSYMHTFNSNVLKIGKSGFKRIKNINIDQNEK